MTPNFKNWFIWTSCICFKIIWNLYRLVESSMVIPECLGRSQHRHKFDLVYKPVYRIWQLDLWILESKLLIQTFVYTSIATLIWLKLFVNHYNISVYQISLYSFMTQTILILKSWDCKTWNFTPIWLKMFVNQNKISAN